MNRGQAHRHTSPNLIHRHLLVPFALLDGLVQFPWCVKSLWCEKLPANYIRYWISVRITREPSLFSVCFTWTGQHTSSLVSNELSTEAEANLFMTISTGTDTWLYLTWLPWSNKICEVICWWHVSKEGIKSVKDSLCTVNSATADAWSPQDKEARACQNFFKCGWCTCCQRRE